MRKLVPVSYAMLRQQTRSGKNWVAVRRGTETFYGKMKTFQIDSFVPPLPSKG